MYTGANWEVKLLPPGGKDHTYQFDEKQDTQSM